MMPTHLTKWSEDILKRLAERPILDGPTNGEFVIVPKGELDALIRRNELLERALGELEPLVNLCQQEGWAIVGECLVEVPRVCEWLKGQQYTSLRESEF